MKYCKESSGRAFMQVTLQGGAEEHVRYLTALAKAIQSLDLTIANPTDQYYLGQLLISLLPAVNQLLEAIDS